MRESANARSAVLAAMSAVHGDAAVSGENADSETLSSVYERRHSKSLTVVCQARRSGGGSPHHSTGRHHVRSTSRTL